MVEARTLVRENAADGLTFTMTGPSQAASPRKPAVLLVHGASASSRTFQEPSPGLLGYLSAKHDVYTLDWRSSMLTADKLVADRAPAGDRAVFNLDASVNDLTGALRFVAKVHHTEPASIAIVGHCIGGALVAQAIAQGLCESKNVVLSALALFFKVGVEGWYKGNDFVLEDLFAGAANPDHIEFPYLKNEPLMNRIISARAATDARYKWPPPLEDRYRFWLDSGLHHGCGIHFCERVSFMYGMPFRVKDMQKLHDDGGLVEQFGSMPLGIYAHCLRNLRRGWAAPYDATGRAEQAWVGEDARQQFKHKRITLITGNENQVWHRNSMDLMSEWLTNGPAVDGLSVTKHVLRNYGHQDLYWSKYAQHDVYPLIAQGLAAP